MDGYGSYGLSHVYFGRYIAWVKTTKKINGFKIIEFKVSIV